MARGRMIDKRIGMSKKLGKAHDRSRTLYFMIYPHLDKEGRIKFEDIEDLKDEIIPKFKDWSYKKIGEALNELADVELIILYPNNKEIAMQFIRFGDFQSGLRKDREADSIVPPPPEDSGVYRITLENSLLSLSLSSRKLKEGSKEKEEKEYIKEFDIFWKIYNLKVAKEDAFNAFKALRRTGVTFETIKAAVKGYANHLKIETWKKQMYPASFLRKEKWKDFVGVEHKPSL